MISCPRVLLAAPAVLVFTLTPSTRASEGTLVVEDLYSPAVAINTVGVDPTRRVFVYLPPGYADTTRPYPTLYWIPGWKTPASQEYIPHPNAAIASGRIPPVIVVHLDGPVFKNVDKFIAPCRIVASYVVADFCRVFFAAEGGSAIGRKHFSSVC